jgi:hypothetical protein
MQSSVIVRTHETIKKQIDDLSFRLRSKSCSPFSGFNEYGELVLEAAGCGIHLDGHPKNIPQTETLIEFLLKLRSRL